HILARSVDDMRRTELRRHLQLVVEQIDGDDRLGAREPRALHGIEPDTTNTDYHDARTGIHLGMTRHRPDTCRHRATDDRGVRPWQILAHRHELLGRTHDHLGERADARHLIHGLAVELIARRAVVHHVARLVVVANAENRAALGTIATIAAIGAER